MDTKSFHDEKKETKKFQLRSKKKGGGAQFAFKSSIGILAQLATSFLVIWSNSQRSNEFIL